MEKPITGKHNHSANRGLWSIMLKHTIKCANTSGLPVIHSANQKGENFGQRITHAVSEAFKLGYKKLLVIGIDNPHLDASTLKIAAETLKRNDYLLEPAEDGGINIIGLSAQCFLPQQFEKLPWKSDLLFSSFLEEIHARGKSVHILPVKQDIDSYQDLEIWLHSNTDNATLCLLVHSVLYKYQIPDAPFEFSSEYDVSLDLDQGRAPPFQN